jgi:hypothetical protein
MTLSQLEGLDESFRDDDVADPNIRKQRFEERSEVEDSRRNGQPLQRGDRPRLVMKFAVIVAKATGLP